MRTDRLDDTRHVGNRNGSRHQQDKKVDGHDRPEHLGHLVGAPGLKEKQGAGDQRRNADQKTLLHPGQSRDQQQTLNSRKDRDGRSNHPIAQQQRNSQKRKEPGKGQQAPLLEQLDQDFPQNNLAPLTFAPQRHGQPGILHRHQNGHGPKHQR